jgi:hypothetical protein
MQRKPGSSSHGTPSTRHGNPQQQRSLT